MKDLNLRKICIDHLVFPRGITNPTLDQVIQAFEDRLQELQRSPGRFANESSAENYDWKQTTTALKSQLTELRSSSTRSAGFQPAVSPTSSRQTSEQPSSVQNKATPPQPNLPTTSHIPNTPKHPDFPPSPTSSRQNLTKPFGTKPTPKLPITNSQLPITNPSLAVPSVFSVPAAPSVNNPPPQPPTAPEPNPTTPQPTPDPTLTLARVLQSAAARKPRPDDKIAALSDDDRQQLIDWLNHMSYDAVAELAAKPRPEGLGLKTSPSALQRFYARHDLNDRLQTAIDILEAAEPESSGPNPLEQTLELLVHAQSVRTASAPNMNDRVLTHFLRHITRLRELQQRERAITIRQKSLTFRMQTEGYDIVAKTMEKLPELNKIAANKNITPREAFQQGFIKVFGQETHDYIQECNRRYRELHPDESDYDPTPETTLPEIELTETEKFRLMLEFPDNTMAEIHAIAAERKRTGQPLTLSGDDAIDRAVGPVRPHASTHVEHDSQQAGNVVGKPSFDPAG